MKTIVFENQAISKHEKKIRFKLKKLVILRKQDVSEAERIKTGGEIH